MTRFGLITATALAAAGVSYPGLAPMPTKLIWNATASAPIGFYTIVPADHIEVLELVAVMPPERSPGSWSRAAMSAVARRS